jgi:hypothetical protein
MIDNLQQWGITFALGAVLWVMDIHVDDVNFWCIIALTVASNIVNFQQGVEQGVVSTMDMVADLSEHQRDELLSMVRKVRAEATE